MLIKRYFELPVVGAILDQNRKFKKKSGGIRVNGIPVLKVHTVLRTPSALNTRMCMPKSNDGTVADEKPGKRRSAIAGCWS